MYKNRTCQRCSAVDWTASKSLFCRLCAESIKKDAAIIKEKEIIIEWGYESIEEPTLNNHNHRTYKLLTPCGHEWSVTFTNLIKQRNNAVSKGLRPACGTCGPKFRFEGALVKYVEKYGRDYDLEVYVDYMKKVRGLSDQNYKRHIDTLNPDGHTRGRNDGHHLDHKMPIIECFKRGLSIEMAASIDNLQMLPWNENLSKGSKCII